MAHITIQIDDSIVDGEELILLNVDWQPEAPENPEDLTAAQKCGLFAVAYITQELLNADESI